MAPLIKTMKQEGVPIPEGFNAKTKMVPSWNGVEEAMGEELSRIEDEVRRKSGTEAKEGKGATLGEGMKWEVLKKVYEEME